MTIKNLDSRRLSQICFAVNRQFPNGLKATPDTLQFYTDQQVGLAIREQLASDQAWMAVLIDPVAGEGEV